MIRGVSKCVVEVNNTENDYFERAILFVRSEKQNTDQSVITQQATSYLKTLTKQGHKRTKTKAAVFYTVAKLACAAGAGATVAGILLRI